MSCCLLNICRYFHILLNSQIVLQFIGHCLVKNARQYFAEKPGDHKNKNDDKDGGRDEDKETARGNDCNKKAVCTHLLKTLHILTDKAVIVDDRSEHPAQLLYDQNGKYAGQEKHDAQRIIIFGKIGAVSAVKPDTEWQRYDNENTGVKHKIEQVFGKKGQFVFHGNSQSFLSVVCDISFCKDTVALLEMNVNKNLSNINKKLFSLNISDMRMTT